MTPLKSNMEIPNIKRILNDSNRLLRSFHTTIPVSYGKFLWCNDWLGTTCFYQNKMCSSHLMFRTDSMNINIQSSIPTNLATRYLGRILNNGTPSDHREYPHMMLNYIIKQLGVYQKIPSGITILDNPDISWYHEWGNHLRRLPWTRYDSQIMNEHQQQHHQQCPDC